MSAAKRIRLAGALTAAGLLVELLTFRWSHPIGFVLMLVAGGGLVVLGVGLYLWALLAGPPSSSG